MIAIKPYRFHFAYYICHTTRTIWRPFFSLNFFPDRGFDYWVNNPIITKNSTNMNIRKLHNDKFDIIGLDASLKTSIIPDDEIIDLRNLARDYYYFKDLQSTIVLKLNAKLKMSFPSYLHVFSKITTKMSANVPERKRTLQLVQSCTKSVTLLLLCFGITNYLK